MKDLRIDLVLSNWVNFIKYLFSISFSRNLKSFKAICFLKHSKIEMLGIFFS